MKIVVAPNAFKHAVSAEDAAHAIYDGILQSGLRSEITLFPVGDGGDGTGRLLSRALNARWIPVNVENPLGHVIQSGFALTNDSSIAIIEMADASGLRLLEKSGLNPLAASSYGTGQLIQAALDYNIGRILLCVGGTATVDAGAGILRALGAELRDHKGHSMSDLPLGLKEVACVDFTNLDARLKNVPMSILTDVENPLLGSNGGIRIFSPQKGATEVEVSLLEEAIEKFAFVLSAFSRKDISTMNRGGAAGGVAATLHAALSAELVSGIDYFLDRTNFDTMITGADWVITGEGKLDAQTLAGKGPMGVSRRAREKGVKTAVFAGIVENQEVLGKVFDVIIPINAGTIATDDELAMTRQRLAEAARRWALALKPG